MSRKLVHKMMGTCLLDGMLFGICLAVQMSLEIDNHFVCRFYLCIWNKDDPHSEEKIIYYLARLKSKEILRDSGNCLVISRDWAKKICLALGQKNSFSRGFDKILALLLVSD